MTFCWTELQILPFLPTLFWAKSVCIKKKNFMFKYFIKLNLNSTSYVTDYWELNFYVKNLNFQEWFEATNVMYWFFMAWEHEGIDIQHPIIMNETFLKGLNARQSFHYPVIISNFENQVIDLCSVALEPLCGRLTKFNLCRCKLSI